ncbi:PepSY domain-containing protein [Novosphingobium beihaiensis]|uniref:PepSY domain-containing protein n=1 Tax=Novosphingobium beihaiensis TaxID=2930389 RepID=A0ABT0BUT8_9SPHN|nr:PepSY domain-containing protein [Novosphingobium beihaiensis]MCJ2188809.1 PepSY domain-containing protein [Novosphingobium beihaiensis]
MPRSSPGLWKRARRWLYWLHRWTGIALCVLFAIWFVSGVVMMYVPFPSFRAAERVASASPLDWRQVRIGPREALERLGADVFPGELRLEMTGTEPVYRASLSGARRALSASSGEEIGPIDAGRAAAIARQFTGAPALRTELVEHDQWVVTRTYARMAPFWRVRVDDGRASDIYVTKRTGEIVQNTDAAERFWNWLGAVPHWIYFEALRIYQAPWVQTVIWTSGIGTISAVLGLWIGILRLRLRRRYKSGSASPYRGWMKWHHVTGLAGGIFVITWTFSGWLSMSPFGGFGSGDAPAIAKRYEGETHPRFAAPDLAVLAASARGAVELRFAHIDGRPTVLAVDQDGAVSAIDGISAKPARPAKRDLEALARKAVPQGRLVDTDLLREHDLYWYTTGDARKAARPVPVLRMTFDDPDESWLYIDPETGELLAQSSKGRRTYRWLFSALHSFDLPFFLAFRPLRDGLMILLSITGLIVSVSGIVVGWRYLVRSVR